MADILKSDPERPRREREQDRNTAALQVFETRRLLDQIAPYILRIRSLIGRITDETLEVACYLLFCNAVQNFEAILLLAREGFDGQIGILVRATIEVLDLIALFLQEIREGRQLKSWFSGNIIPNAEAQKSTHRFLNQGRSEPVDVRGLQSGIYFALSSYTHGSYMSLIHSIDPYTRDFDWSRTGGSHHVLHGALPFAKQIVVKLVITLKQFYRFHLHEDVACAELDDILNRANSD